MGLVIAELVQPEAKTGNTADAYADVLTLEVRGYPQKTLWVKNTGGANGLTYQVLGSLDGGVSYDLTLVAPASLAAAADSGAIQSSIRCTHIKVQLKSQNAGQATSYTVKGVASSL